MDRWMNVRNIRMHGLMNGWSYEQTDGWIDGLMNGWMMEEGRNECGVMG